MKTMNFSEALDALKGGKSVAREGWTQRNPEGVGMSISLVPQADVYGRIAPYLQAYTAEGQIVPWVPSHADILADDWRLIGFQP